MGQLRTCVTDRKIKVNEADLSIRALQTRRLKWAASAMIIVCACMAQTYVTYAQSSFEAGAAPSAEPYPLFLSAKRYHDGDGTAQDYDKARRLYERAASLGSVEAHINLGYMYFVGEGVVQDYARARGWYLKVSETKAARANLAAMYEYGLGVQPDPVQAQAWREPPREPVAAKSVFLNLRPSSVLSSSATSTSKPPSKSKPSASRKRKTLAPSVTRGLKTAPPKIMAPISAPPKKFETLNREPSVLEPPVGESFLYSSEAQTPHVRRSYAALEHDARTPATHELADDKLTNEGLTDDGFVDNAPEISGDDPQSLFLSAKRYHDGDGMAQNFIKAHRLYEKAATLGNKNAQINLGYMYFVGEGVPQDYKIAREWYLQASDTIEARTNLAAMYEYGLGVEKDPLAAQAWRFKAPPPRTSIEPHNSAVPLEVPVVSTAALASTPIVVPTPVVVQPATVASAPAQTLPAQTVPIIPLVSVATGAPILDISANEPSIYGPPIADGFVINDSSAKSLPKSVASQTHQQSRTNIISSPSPISLPGLETTGAPISLQQAFRAAYRSNPEILAARQEFEISETDIDLAKSGRKPLIEANASYGYLDQDSRFDEAPSSSISGDTSNLGVSLSQPIFRGFQTRHGISQAQSLSLANQLEIESVEQRVFLEVATAYLGVQRDLNILRLNVENLETLKGQLKANQKRYELKDASLTDVARSQAAVAGALSQVAASRSNYTATKSRFFRLTGLQADNLVPLSNPSTTPPPLEEFVTIVQKRNASILSAQHALEASESALKQAKGARLPTVDFNTSLNRNDGPVNFGTFSDNRVTTSASANVTVRVPLYQAGQEFGNIKRAKQVRRLREIELQQINANVWDESRTVWDRLHATQTTLSTYQEAVNAAQTAALGTRKIYQSGLISAIDLIDTEQTLLNTKIEHERARHDHLTSLYSLLSLMGAISLG